MSARVLVGPELCSALASRFPPVSERRPESPGRRAAEIRTLAVLDRQTFQPGGQGRPENPPTGRRTRAFRPRGPPRHAAFREAQARGEELEKHNDFIQWLMDEHRAKGNEVTPDELAQNIFIIMVASMHGTPSFAYSVLLDLLDYPATLAEIREEIGRVRRDELGGAPVWSRHALGELRLLDSFMRETLRVHPFTEGMDSIIPSLPCLVFISTSDSHILALLTDSLSLFSSFCSDDAKDCRRPIYLQRRPQHPRRPLRQRPLPTAQPGPRCIWARC